MDLSDSLYRVLDAFRRECIRLLAPAKGPVPHEEELDRAFLDAFQRVRNVCSASRIDLDHLYACLAPKIIPGQE